MVQNTWEDSLFQGEYGYGEGEGPFFSYLGLLGDEFHEDALDGWHDTFDNKFALDYLKSLLLTALPTQLAPVQCCTSCTSITAAECNISLSHVSATEKDCQICALLLRAARAVKRHSHHDERNARIVRTGSALKLRYIGPQILRLYSDLESSAALSNNFKVGLPVLPKPNSPARFALLRAWFRWCDETHKCNSHSKSALPTRLLYVGDPDPGVLCLYCPKKDDRVEYIALSHCWGKLTEERKRQFCTTDENIQTRLKGFSFSSLPKTFRDAVRVTRELGIRYLWIDSLCIIQWNQIDWEHEAKRMEDVFASAYCTIAATSAVDSDAGFLERNVSNEYIYTQDATGRRFYICADTDNSNNYVDLDDFDDHVEKAQMNTRAWVMQERVLSRRTIHFSDKQMFWECGRGVYCETLTKLESFYRKRFFILDPNFPEMLLQSGDRRTVEFVHFLLENYSKRGLTKDTDRCVALSGMEARIARATGCKSRYGTFERYRHRNLLWQRSDGEKMKQIAYKNQVVPSWSWMAYDGGIQFMDIPFGDVDWNSEVRFTEEHENALVTDVGVFRNCSLEQRNTIYAVLDSGKVETGWIQYDVEEGEDIYKEHCVVVGKVRKEKSEDKDKSIEEYYILAVRPTCVDGEFRRVGVGRIQSNHVVRQSEARIV